MSRFKGITAVPTFLLGQHRLVGAQNYEAMAELFAFYGIGGKKQAGTTKPDMELQDMNTKTAILSTLTLQGRFEVIVHGCNCFCTMGGGIARVIQEEFPEAYAADLVTIKGDRNKLGDFSVATVNRKAGKSPSSTATPSSTSTAKMSWSITMPSADSLPRSKKQFSGKRIGYPKIGAGLGGGDWDRISAIIDEELAGEDHSLVLYSP